MKIIVSTSTMGERTFEVEPGQFSPLFHTLAAIRPPADPRIDPAQEALAFLHIAALEDARQYRREQDALLRAFMRQTRNPRRPL